MAKNYTATVNPVPPMEIEDFLVGPPAMCVYSLLITLDLPQS
jgi:hypothetical protein